MDPRLKRAYRLWKQYKTRTPEYAALAESLGMRDTDLNVRCSEIRAQLMRNRGLAKRLKRLTPQSTL